LSPNVYISEQAEHDLEEIADFIALDSPSRAVSFIAEVREHCQRAATSPLIYPRRPEIGSEVRVCFHGSYLIFFEPAAEGIVVLRILHGARNYLQDDWGL
jgi:toxin ParE1/3/4